MGYLKLKRDQLTMQRLYSIILDSVQVTDGPLHEKIGRMLWLKLINFFNRGSEVRLKGETVKQISRQLGS